MDEPDPTRVFSERPIVNGRLRELVTASRTDGRLDPQVSDGLVTHRPEAEECNFAH